MSQVAIITLDQLTGELEAGALAQFWNVLTDEFFKGDLIPASRRVPLDRVGREVAESRIAKDAAIVTYCSGPGCPQSKAAAEKLMALGFTNVRAFEGGLEAWKAAGRPLDPYVRTKQEDDHGRSLTRAG
jgi:rhodanese-related sulfurtransferase